MLYGIPAARGRSTLKNEMRRQELYWRRRVGLVPGGRAPQPPTPLTPFGR
jgi:hypothetical protein